MGMTKLKKIHFAWKKFMVQSTFHGTQYVIISPMRWERIVWACMVTAAVIYSLIQITNRTEKFLSRPVEIKTSVSDILIWNISL